MMTECRQLRLALLLGTWAGPLALAPGCTRPNASLQITSYKDPYYPETYDVELAECAYYVGPAGDYHIVGRAVHTPAEGGGGTITQVLHVHVFWKPWPGKTFDNPTSVDSVIRYAIVTEQGAAVYCGTGFVYPKQRRPGGKVIADIEVARLRLDSRVGDPPELLGRARVAGRLIAENDASLAVDLRRQLDVHGHRSRAGAEALSPG